MSLAETLDRAVVPLDRLRRFSFKWVVRQPRLRPLVLHRDTRLPLLASAHALLAFVIALVAPVLLFFLGPILLGVVHVASDVRHLLLRRTLPTWWKLILILGSSAFLGIRGFAELGWLARTAAVEVGGVTLWLLFPICAGLLGAASRNKAVAALFLIAPIAAIALRHPETARLVFVHVHNVVAVVVWVFLFRPNVRAFRIPLILMLLGLVVFLSGALFRIPLSVPTVRLFGVHVLEAATWLAPGFRADYAIGILSAYVFCQSIHYAIWLHLIPQQETPSARSLTFKRSVQLLRTDFRLGGLLIVGVCMVLVWVGAGVSIHRAQQLYLSFATFHGYFELVSLAYFWIHGRPAVSQ